MMLFRSDQTSAYADHTKRSKEMGYLKEGNRPKSIRCKAQVQNSSPCHDACHLNGFFGLPVSPVLHPGPNPKLLPILLVMCCVYVLMVVITVIES